jgi:predicted O-linked N-acetylglucosamine transferase (SPINDLY family)
VNAHTTASDALWAGVPVLTCPGKSFAARVAASLNRACKLDEMVVHSLPDYEALAIKFAHKPLLLAAIRRKLASARMTLPLFDTQAQTRHIEVAYRAMWERAERGEAPAPFAIAPDGSRV